MIERYSDKKISKIWSDEHKVFLWDQLELAVIKAREELGRVPVGTHRQIAGKLLQHPVDIAWWKSREEETKHDLNAYIDERLRHLDQKSHQYFHAGMTSYDTEEQPFQWRILESVAVIQEKYLELIETLRRIGNAHMSTPMLGRTHGQEAKPQSFGKRVITWVAQLQVDVVFIEQAGDRLRRSKLSGAIGNYQGIDELLERDALSRLGFSPFYGATQIMPRNLHSALADALARLCLSMAKIAEDIRLAGRSGHALIHEPFGKQQKGSSAMPHKKNTISTEQLIGMARMANTKAMAIRENIVTWEERAIEQSCVERVEWPDLLHITSHMLKTLNRVASGMVIYKEKMAEEIEKSFGTYASEDVKDFLKKHGETHGLTHEDAYRITQLACFIAFEDKVNLQMIVQNRFLRTIPQLDAREEQIEEWKKVLVRIFREIGLEQFSELFTVEYQLRGEKSLIHLIDANCIPIS